MVDVVGLRFVTEGEQKLINAIQRVDTAQQQLEKTSQALGRAIARGSATQDAAIRAYLALERSGMSYANVLKGVAQNERMAADAAQHHIGQLLGLDQAAKSAKDSANAMAVALRAQEEAAARVAPAINDLLRIDAPFQSAARSAEVFSTELRKQEAATTATARTTQEFYRNLLRLDQPYSSAETSAAAFTAELRKQDAATATAARATQDFYRDLLQLDRPYDSAEASAAAFVTELRKQEAATAATARATQQFYRDLFQIDRPYASAAASAEVFVQAQQRANASYAQLRADVDPAYAAQMRMRQAHEVVKQALAQEVITREEAARTLVAYRAQVQQVSVAMRGQTAASMFASRAQNATGMALQQTGYQVGDFLVQIQSGTNAFVAFGQQATQLVGILPMFGSVMGISGTALIGLSAGLGIAIPLVTALAAAFMRTRQSAEDAAGGIDSLASQIESANRSTQDFIDRIEIMNRGLASSQELALVRGLEEAEAALASAIAEAQRFSEAVLTGEMAPEFLAAYDEAARAAGELVKLRQEELDAHRQQRAEAERLERAEEARLDSLRRFYELRQQEEDLNAERRAGVQAILQAVEAENRSLQERADILRLTIQYGADSVQVRAREAEIAREAFASEMQRNGILGNNLALVMETYDEMARLRGAADASAAAAERLAARMASVADRARAAAQATLGIFQALRASLAELDAREAGIAAAQRTMARGGSEVDARATMAGVSEEARLRGLGATDAEIAAGAAMAAAAERRRLQAEAAERALFARGTGGGGGGGGGDTQAEVVTLEALVATMQQQIDQEIRLIGLHGEERRALELTTEIQERLRQEGQDYTEEAVANAAREIAAREAVRDQMQQYHADMQRLGQTIERSFADAFMSVVDGTKSAEDAFKDMARSIIAELFRVLVVQQLVGQIGTALGGSGGWGGLIRLSPAANGMVVNNANVVPFANGGVVGSPTLFPLSGGRTGLMGEAGPEAIMPLKRGRDGKLGVQAEGGGSVVVNNHFHVAANGDESVKRIVAQQVPAIAEATKAAVIDARQRGGKMRAAFR